MTLGGKNIYTPEISEVQIRKLYRLKLKSGKPMTKLVAEAIELYLSSMERRSSAKRDGVERNKDEAPESKKQ